MFNDDETISPQLKIYFFYDDLANGNVSEYKTIPYTKDGVKREITAKLELKNNLVTHIKGVILDYNNSDRKFKNHVTVSNIKLTYEPFLKPKKVKRTEKPAEIM
jgi:uncharacterized protein (UPF0333 family)